MNGRMNQLQVYSVRTPLITTAGPLVITSAPPTIFTLTTDTTTVSTGSMQLQRRLAVIKSIYAASYLSPVPTVISGTASGTLVQSGITF